MHPQSHPVVPGSTRLAYGFKLASILFMGFVISQCYKENPYIKRRQLIFMPRSIEHYIGNSVAEYYRKKANYTNNVNDKPVEDYLRKIVSQIISPYKEYKPEDWKVHLIHDDTVNACAIAGGNVFVNTGFLKFCKNPHEIAFMLGHEISHVEGRHMAENLSVMLPLICAVYAVTLYFTESHDYDWAVNLGFQYLIQLPKSRAHEYEADKMATFLCKKSGFDPIKGVEFFKRMEHSHMEFLATHPLHENRIEKVNQEEKKIIAEFDQNSRKKLKEICNEYLIIDKVKII